MNPLKIHKPECLANTSCLVLHMNGVCSSPYGKCTCDEASPHSDPKEGVEAGEEASMNEIHQHTTKTGSFKCIECGGWLLVTNEEKEWPPKINEKPLCQECLGGNGLCEFHKSPAPKEIGEWEKLIDNFLDELKDDFTGGDMHDWEYGKLRLRPLLRDLLSSQLTVILNEVEGAMIIEKGKIQVRYGSGQEHEVEIDSDRAVFFNSGLLCAKEIISKHRQSNG